MPKKQSKGNDNKAKRLFTKGDFEAVLKSATKPLKQGQAEKESAKT